MSRIWPRDHSEGGARTNKLLHITMSVAKQTCQACHTAAMLRAVTIQSSSRSSPINSSEWAVCLIWFHFLCHFSSYPPCEWSLHHRQAITPRQMAIDFIIYTYLSISLTAAAALREDSCSSSSLYCELPPLPALISPLMNLHCLFL